MASSTPTAQLRKALRENLERLGVDIATVTLDERGTISPSRQVDAPIDVSSLPLFDLGEVPMFDARPRLEVSDTLGGGGMGIVKAAHQAELGREVAVKMSRPDQTDSAAGALLREALVTGMLQHPNLVPVHALGRTIDSHPVMVMKRIDGTRWPIAKPVPAGADDLIDYLEVLLQVCDAVSYAHARGIVHRDLKLDNVMIGSLGEVYVLDWGLAVSLREEHAARLPLASEVDTLAGTPAFMAPEMALVGKHRIDARTDVYLLGAMLHEIVTGRARHDGGNVEDALVSAIASAHVSYDDDVPFELAMICNRAMHRDPDDRFETVDAFREAVEAFVKQTPSRHLAAQASVRLARMEVAAEHESRGIEVAAEEFHRLASEARFAFQEALLQYPENGVAERGLWRTIELMASHEIRRGNAAAAEDLMTELAAPSAELDAALEALHVSRRRQAREVQSMTQRVRESDLREHTPQRRRYLMSLGAVVCAVVVSFGLLNDLGLVAIAYPHILLAGGICAAATVAGAMSMTRMGVNVANRRLANSVAIVGCSITAFLYICYMFELPVTQALSLVLFVAGTVTAVLAMTLARGMLLTAITYLIGGFAMSLWPSRDYELMALSFAVGFTFLAFPLSRFVHAWHRPIIDVSDESS